MNAQDRALRARIASYESWAKTTDRTARTAAGTKASMDRFTRQVDPDGTLPAEERALQAEAAKKAYFARLALKSAQARRVRSRDAAEAKARAAELRQQRSA